MSDEIGTTSHLLSPKAMYFIYGHIVLVARPSYIIGVVHHMGLLQFHIL
jgi:hypothetical protein